MTTRNLALIGLLCLGTAGGVAYTPPVEARTFVDLDINVAPPAPRYEQVVVRPGYVWAPGYWRWDGHGHHVWVGGYYMHERAGMALGTAPLGAGTAWRLALWKKATGLADPAHSRCKKTPA